MRTVGVVRLRTRRAAIAPIHRPISREFTKRRDRWRRTTCRPAV